MITEYRGLYSLLEIPEEITKTLFNIRQALVINDEMEDKWNLYLTSSLNDIACQNMTIADLKKSDTYKKLQETRTKLYEQQEALEDQLHKWAQSSNNQ